MNYCKYRCLVVFFIIFYQGHCEDIIHHPFGDSIYALEKNFLLNYEVFTYPESVSCEKIYLKINPYHKEHRIRESCSVVRSPASYGYPIGFKKFSRLNKLGLKVDLELCTCNTKKLIKGIPKKVLHNESFQVAMLDNQKYFIFKHGNGENDYLYVKDYVEFLTEKPNSNISDNAIEIPVDKELSRVRMDIQAVEGSFIEDHNVIVNSISTDSSWGILAPKRGCLEIYRSFKKNFNILEEQNENLVSNCLTIHLEAGKGYKISFKHFPDHEAVSMNLAFCECNTKIRNTKIAKKNDLDETQFYIAKHVNCYEGSSYYLLVDSYENPEFLKVIGYFQFQWGSVPAQTSINKIIKMVRRPYKDQSQIEMRYVAAYREDLPWGEDWLNQDYSVVCVDLYSTIKYIDVEMDIDLQNKCDFVLHPENDAYFSAFPAGIKLLNVVECRCWKENEYSSDFHERSRFFIVKMEGVEHYYRLIEKENEEGNLVPIDYVIFL